MKAKLLGVAAGLVLSSMFTGFAAEAEESRLVSCIKQYTDLGVSADSALSECKQKTLADCVKELMKGKYLATSIKFVDPRAGVSGSNETGYLIDLGNQESRWLEGGQWAEKGCIAYTRGPYNREDVPKKGLFGKRRSYQWFRQGWCSQSSIELEQPYTLEEAKLRCELGVAPEQKDKAQPEMQIKVF